VLDKAAIRRRIAWTSKEYSMAAKSVILVHGAWADGTSWSKVIPPLVKMGLDVTAVQLPLTALADDVSTVRRAIKLATGPIVLAGHSYGGVVITEAGDDAEVTSLVYVAAFGPDSGESAGSLGSSVAPAPLAAEVRPDSEGFLKLTRKGVFDCFAQDLTEAEKLVLYASQAPTNGAALGGTVSSPGWRTKPSWYLVAANDQAISPKLQRTMAFRMKAITVEVAASHAAMLAKPAETAELIGKAAQ
jgi:pimeloyl-ACP methyl ester carboxylesterase